ncbi:MAG TPA: tetratricopeptide repeat protein [Tepidisphaeraceae bacterium]
MVVCFGLFKTATYLIGGPAVASAKWTAHAKAKPNAAPPRKPATAPAGKLVNAEPTKPAPALMKAAGSSSKLLPAKAAVTTATKPAALSPDQLLKSASPAVALVQVRDNSLRPRGQAAGFFVSSDGLFVTNLHAIANSSFASVQTSDGRALFVEGVAASDEAADLALLKVRTTSASFLKLATGVTNSGAKLSAVTLAPGTSARIVQGQLGNMDVERGLHPFRASAVATTNLSGAPLLNSEGAVAGMTSVTVAGEQTRSFAISAERIGSLINQKQPIVPIASAAGDTLSSADAMAFAQAFMALDRGDLKGASAILTRLRPRQSRNPLYWFLDGSLHAMLSNFDVAADSYRQALKLKPDMTMAHESLANVLSSQGELREAIKEYRAVAKCDPTNWLAYQSAGVASSMLGENEKAVAYFDYAIALEPRRAHLHRYRGQALADLGRNIDAFAAFKNALKLDPNDSTTYASIGALHLKLGHPAEAMTALKKSLSLDRTNPTAYLLYGDSAFSVKDMPTARAAWQNAIRFDVPSGPIAKKASEKLKYLGDVAAR